MSNKYLDNLFLIELSTKDSELFKNYSARLISDFTHLPVAFLEENLEEVNFDSYATDMDDNHCYFQIMSRDNENPLSFRYQLNYTAEYLKNIYKDLDLKYGSIIDIDKFNRYNMPDLFDVAYFVNTRTNCADPHYDFLNIFYINLAYFKDKDYQKLESDLEKHTALLAISDIEALKSLYQNDTFMLELIKKLEEYSKKLNKPLYTLVEEVEEED